MESEKLLFNMTDVPVLMYHSIADHAVARYQTWTVTPQQFAAQMHYLHSHDYTPITVAQYAICRTQPELLPAKPVVITFDDGYADFYTQAWPILQYYRFVASMYVVTGLPESTQPTPADLAPIPYMTWAQLHQIQQGGIEVAAHTHSHVKLDTVALPQAEWEICHSKAVLEAKLGRSVTTFAYPYGRYSPAVCAAVKQAGYAAACAVRYDMSALNDEVLALARIIVQPNHSLADFAALLTRQGVRRKLLVQRLKARLWRIALRAYLTTVAVPTLGAALG